MKRTLFYGATALGFLFASCSSDDLVQPDVNAPVTENQTLYVNMRIIGDGVSGSRAASSDGKPDISDFEDGTENGENEVNNVYFVFYDENGNVIGDITPVDLNSFTVNDELKGDIVEKAYSSVVSVSVKKGEKKPSQVICYLNPISPSTLQNPLDVMQSISRSSAYTTVGTQKYFAMSNSVYYPDGEAPESLPQIAVQIPSENLYESEEAAKAALGTENAVDIYVERYAAKLAFKAVEPTDYLTGSRLYNEDGTTGETSSINLKFEPQYWAVNAESNRTYVIKSFREESEKGELLGHNFDYETLDRIINVAKPLFYDGAVLNNEKAWDWNNPDYKRSYWGMSPAYFTETYPEVSSDLADIVVNQKYISYNELVNGTCGFDADENDAKYFKETTVGSRALESANPAAAVASVIYVGQYKLSVNGTEVTGYPSFYTYIPGPVQVDGQNVNRPYIYFDSEANSVTSKVDGGESMLKRFLAQSTILYKPVLEGNEIVDYTRLTIGNAEDLQTLINALEVSEISDEVKIAYDGDETTKTKFQNNTRTLQFKNADAAKGIYILTGNGYNQIVPDDAEAGNNQVHLTEANLTLMRQVGYSYYYTTGHAYFNIPVKHFGWYRKGNAQKDGNTIDWSQVRVGDFGMVRNHSYSINVQEVKGLASGIGDDDNPIVPPSHTTDYYMAYSVRILKWAVVPTQHTKL